MRTGWREGQDGKGKGSAVQIMYVELSPPSDMYFKNRSERGLYEEALHTYTYTHIYSLGGKNNDQVLGFVK